MTLPRVGVLKDGRLAGLLSRRALEALVRRPTEVVSPEDLAAAVWPNGVPRTWRIALPATVRRTNEALGRSAIVRIGNQARLIGFRLDVRQLPPGNWTQRKRRQPKRQPWSAAENRVVREYAGRVTLSELTALVNAVHCRERKTTTVEGQIYRLGLSKRVRAYSANSLAPLLGITGERIARLIAVGRLNARRTEPDGWTPESQRWGWWLIDQADVEAFLRAYPWEYDWRSMQPGHRLKVLAQAIQRGQAYLTLKEFARRGRMSESTVLRGLHAGQVEGAERVTPGATGTSVDRACWRIPVSALDSFNPRRRRSPGRRIKEAQTHGD